MFWSKLDAFAIRPSLQEVRSSEHVAVAVRFGLKSSLKLCFWAVLHPEVWRQLTLCRCLQCVVSSLWTLCSGSTRAHFSSGLSRWLAEPCPVFCCSPSRRSTICCSPPRCLPHTPKPIQMCIKQSDRKTLTWRLWGWICESDFPFCYPASR